MGQGFDLLLSILGRFGWLGNWLFLLIAMGECVPFAGGIFPGGTLIYLASVLAAQGYFNIWDVFLFSAVGAILGDYLGYSLGRWGGPFLARHNIIKPELYARAHEFFRKHGNKSILWGRFIGPLRAVVPFIAGASRMPAGPFLLWNIISSLIWASVATALGYFSGNIIAVIIRKWSSPLGWLLLAAGVVALAYWLAKKHGRSIQEYLRQQDAVFADKLLASRWMSRLSERYPTLFELAQTSIRYGKTVSIILGFGVLLGLYIITLIFDLF